MLECQELRLKIDAKPQLTGGQKPSESIHCLLKIAMIQAVQALSDLCQHILNTCTVLNRIIVFKLHVFIAYIYCFINLEPIEESNSLIFELVNI